MLRCTFRTLQSVSVSLLDTLMTHVQRGDLPTAAEAHESSLPSRSSCAPSSFPHERRDVSCLMMRVYTSLGKKDMVRGVFLRALKELPPRFINQVLFDHFLEALTKSKNLAKDEIREVLAEMKMRQIPWSPMTYLYLIEMHLRMDMDPMALWTEMLKEVPDDQIPECLVRAMVTRVLPVTKDPKYILSMIRQLLTGGGDVSGKTLVELLGVVVEHPDCSPQSAVWILMELEQRCLLSQDEAQALSKIVQPHAIVQILYRCAKSLDIATMELLMGLVDRHGLTRTPDMLGLVVLTYATSGCVERALDLVELMARRGMLDVQDPFRKFSLDSLGIHLEKHYLMAVSEAMGNATEVDRGYQHLLRRIAENRSVTVHSLDLLVLAASKCKDEVKALQILDSYASSFQACPRTVTYNCLLIAVIGHRNPQLHHEIFTKMEKNGIPPNNITFRFLIRHCLQCDDVFSALEYIRKVANYPHIRVDVEMILPIFERSARVGDVETAVEMSQLALDCDVGIDAAVMNNVTKLLQGLGQDVQALKGHFPLHEALRARTKGLLRRGSNSRGRQ
jgi:hypothetical protein